VPVLEPRSAAQEAIRVFFDELLGKVTIAERHCREDVMACPALEKQVDDGFVAHSCGPTDHVAPVHVSRPVHISAGIEEKAGGVEHSIRRREMEQRRVVPDVASAWIRAVFEEQPHGLWMPYGDVQPSGAPSQAFASETWISLQQLAQRVDVSGRACPHELGEVRCPPEIQFGLQRTPAREPVLARDRQLGISQLCLGVPPPQQREALFVLRGRDGYLLDRLGAGRTSLRH
jgi:hypothetical protein